MYFSRINFLRKKSNKVPSATFLSVSCPIKFQLLHPLEYTIYPSIYRPSKNPNVNATRKEVGESWSPLGCHPLPIPELGTDRNEGGGGGGVGRRSGCDMGCFYRRSGAVQWAVRTKNGTEGTALIFWLNFGKSSPHFNRNEFWGMFPKVSETYYTIILEVVQNNPSESTRK